MSIDGWDGVERREALAPSLEGVHSLDELPRMPKPMFDGLMERLMRGEGVHIAPRTPDANKFKWPDIVEVQMRPGDRLMLTPDASSRVEEHIAKLVQERVLGGDTRFDIAAHFRASYFPPKQLRERHVRRIVPRNLNVHGKVLPSDVLEQCLLSQHSPTLQRWGSRAGQMHIGQLRGAKATVIFVINGFITMIGDSQTSVVRRIVHKGGFRAGTDMGMVTSVAFLKNHPHTASTDFA